MPEPQFTVERGRGALTFRRSFGSQWHLWGNAVGGLILGLGLIAATIREPHPWPLGIAGIALLAGIASLVSALRCPTYILDFGAGELRAETRIALGPRRATRRLESIHKAGMVSSEEWVEEGMAGAQRTRRRPLYGLQLEFKTARGRPAKPRELQRERGGLLPLRLRIPLGRDKGQAERVAEEVVAALGLERLARWTVTDATE